MTSPDDQDLICSGDASEMRMALNSLTSSIRVIPRIRRCSASESLAIPWHLVVRDRRDAETGTDIGERVDSPELVKQAVGGVTQFQAQVGQNQSWGHFGHLELVYASRAKTDSAIHLEQSLELSRPLALRSDRDQPDLLAVAGDVSGIGEVIGDSRRVQPLERGAIRFEKDFDVRVGRDHGAHSSKPEMLMPRSGTYEDEVSSAKRISCSFSLSTSTERPSDCNSLMSTLKDSGTPGGWMSSPLTMASYVCTRPCTSSDFTVSNSWRMYAAP